MVMLFGKPPVRIILLPLFAIVVFLFTATPIAYACSAFLAQEGDLVLFGNNEDYMNPFTKMWFMPGDDGTYGRVYFGYDDLNPQGGMNEAGLCFDFFATEPVPVTKSIDKDEYPGNIYDAIMEECATVDEALGFLTHYNRKSMERYMVMFADRNGDSVIVEGDEILRKSGDFQVITNFYQSKNPGGKDGDGYSVCQRFETANKMLNTDEPFSLDKAKKILLAVSQNGHSKTLYSNIYDPKNGLVYLYHFRDFDNEVVINLSEELMKKQGFVDLPSLFPAKPAHDAFMEQQLGELRKRRGGRAVVDVSASVLEKYAGRYDNPNKGLTLLVDDGRLFAQFAEDLQAPLYAFSETEFLLQLYNIDLRFNFTINGEKQVEGFTLKETYYYPNADLPPSSALFERVD